MLRVPWYNIFSYWGFIAWFIWLLGAPFSPAVPLAINLIMSIFFVAVKYEKTTPAGLFIIATHAIPMYSLRHADLDVKTFVVMYLLYALWLDSQGLTPMSVYKTLLKEPSPVTVREYLKSRVLLRW
jgi:hypothetical protein